MTWDFEGEARDLRDTIHCIRHQDAVDSGDLNRLLDALLPETIRHTVLNGARAQLDDKWDALLCGATTTDGTGARCNRAPHGAPDRYHQELLADGMLWAEWSSVLPQDDDERLWPDGNVGPRLPKDRAERLRRSS